MNIFYNTCINLLKDTQNIIDFLNTGFSGITPLYLVSWGGLLVVFSIMVAHMLIDW